MIKEKVIVYPVSGRGLGAFLYRERRSVLVYLLFTPLWILSQLYCVAVKLRVFLYEKGIFRSVRLDAYTVSVGNLTVGGTGKTPLVARMAGDLAGRGCSTSILSRGYRRKLSGGTLRVLSHPGSIAAVKRSGDEPAMLARRLPDVPVIVDAKRSRGGEYAVSRCAARVLILDDGFSHLALKRDCNILLVDGKRGFGPGWTLPLGPLREPLGHISRAEHIMIVGGTVESRRALREKLRLEYGCGSIMEAIYEPSELVSIEYPFGTRPLGFLDGKRCIAFSGLASPAPFENSIRRLGGKLLGSFRFPDHYWYDRDDREMITRRAQNVAAELILTTEKDSVKVLRCNSLIPIYYLRVELKIVAGEDIYKSILKKALKESTMTMKKLETRNLKFENRRKI